MGPDMVPHLGSGCSQHSFASIPAWGDRQNGCSPRGPPPSPAPCNPAGSDSIKNRGSERPAGTGERLTSPKTRRHLQVPRELHGRPPGNGNSVLSKGTESGRLKGLQGGWRHRLGTMHRAAGLGLGSTRRGAAYSSPSSAPRGAGAASFLGGPKATDPASCRQAALGPHSLSASSSSSRRRLAGTGAPSPPPPRPSARPRPGPCRGAASSEHDSQRIWGAGAASAAGLSGKAREVGGASPDWSGERPRPPPRLARSPETRPSSGLVRR